MHRRFGSHYPHQLELVICDAIARRCLITFDYNGVRRIAQPYCHGFTRTGAETIRAVEVGGRGGAFGKLWTVAKVKNLRLIAEHFTPDDPDYNSDDSAMAEIHCRVTPELAPCPGPPNGQSRDEHREQGGIRLDHCEP